MLDKLLFGENYLIYKVEEIDKLDEIIFYKKSQIESVDQFIDMYKDMENRDFCQSIKKDIVLVKNIISYDISSFFC